MSDRIEDGGPAFPARPDATTDIYGRDVSSGLTARQYAAIQLRVPNSGTKWLDDMIRESLRDRFAEQMVAGIMQSIVPDDEEDAAGWAYKIADALLAARKGGQS